MKTADSALITLLNTSTQFRMIDLYAFATASGTSYYCAGDINVTYLGNVYSATGPLIKRSGTRTTIGLETDTMKITVQASATHLIEGLPFVQAAVRGALDAARVSVFRAFFDSWANAPVGVVKQFSGRVSTIRSSRNQVDIEVKDDTEILTTKMPRNLYQPPCVNTLYDSACGVLRSAFLVNGTATGGSVSHVTSALAQATKYFEQGTLKFTSGLNIDIKRTVKTFNGGRFDFVLPLPYVPQSGDTFQALPGCDKSTTTCSGKFGNLPRNTSFPYVPAAEVAL